MTPTRAFGSTQRDVPVIGEGTWQMEHDEPAAALAALEHGVDLGLTHLDTAEMYGDGAVESLIAPLVRRRRDELFLVSKVLPSNATRRGVVQACEGSLTRLGTDRLDCYLLHWPGSHPLEETIAGFEDLVKAGKIRAWGVSNFDVGDLEEALRIAGSGRIACNQVLYHLEERHIEAEVLPTCAKHGIAVVAYSPFGSGAFPSANSAAGKVLARVARDNGASPRQVALAFLTRENPLFAIPKAAQAAHVEDNARAAALKLSSDDLRAIDEAFPLKVKRELPVI